MNRVQNIVEHAEVAVSQRLKKHLVERLEADLTVSPADFWSSVAGDISNFINHKINQSLSLNVEEPLQDCCYPTMDSKGNCVILLENDFAFSHLLNALLCQLQLKGWKCFVLDVTSQKWSEHFWFRGEASSEAPLFVDWVLDCTVKNWDIYQMPLFNEAINYCPWILLEGVSKHCADINYCAKVDIFAPNLEHLSYETSFKNANWYFHKCYLNEFTLSGYVNEIKASVNDEKLIVAEANVIHLPNLERYLTERQENDHKGKRGKGLLLAGSSGMWGANMLATEACLRTGIGYLYQILPSDGYGPILSKYPQCLITQTEKLLELPAKLDAIAIGSGMANNDYIAEQLIEVLNSPVTKIIIDADALNYLAKHPELHKQLTSAVHDKTKEIVLTPHYKEALRLWQSAKEQLNKGTVQGIPASRLQRLMYLQKQTDISRLELLEALTLYFNSIVVLKGHHTLIGSLLGEQLIVTVNVTGNDELAKAGSGDVLTGLMLGFACQCEKLQQAIELAVCVQGRLADKAVERGEQNLLISDLVKSLPEVWREIFR